VVYREKKAQADVKQILKLYRQDGFIDAKVEQKREFASKDTVNMAFDITEGERFRIGQVEITGNEQTQDKVIRRVLDEYDFQPGQWYNADTVRGDGSGELEKTVKNTVLLENITITPAGKKPGQRDAQVNVTEGQTGMVMIGAGVASDSGIIGQLTFEQRNFDITNKPKGFGELITGQAYKGAGQNLRIAMEPGTEVSQYSVAFSDPYFRDKPVSFDIIGSSYERGFESYDEKRLKGFVGFENREKDHWRKSIGFRVENVDVANIETDAPQEIKDVSGNNLLASVIFGIGRDLTDSRFTPSKGIIYNVNYEQTGGDYTFGILSGTYKYFSTLYEDLAERKTILATRLYAATTVGDAPPFEKFYAGGSTSIRGFEYRGVSTRGLQTGVPNPKREDPIGSDWIFLANAEVAVPVISENFSWLFFVDSGAIDTGGYRASVGTGIQILIPQWFGPVPMRFEFAMPFMKAEGDVTQVFSFSIGRLF
jgi:outer membrane protein insertion porin family